MALLEHVPWTALASTALAYFAGLVFYRLYLHPLANFPGPKLAAITRYYEGYYDVVRNGQYTFKIAELHQLAERVIAGLSENHPGYCGRIIALQG